MCVHNLVHEKSTDILKGLYKSAVFTLQAIAFLQTGRYEKKKRDLLLVLQEEDRSVLTAGMAIKEKTNLSKEEQKMFSAELLSFASRWICEV